MDKQSDGVLHNHGQRACPLPLYWYAPNLKLLGQTLTVHTCLKNKLSIRDPVPDVKSIHVYRSGSIGLHIVR